MIKLTVYMYATILILQLLLTFQVDSCDPEAERTGAVKSFERLLIGAYILSLCVCVILMMMIAIFYWHLATNSVRLLLL